jgi:hypothetical protein
MAQRLVSTASIVGTVTGSRTLAALDAVFNVQKAIDQLTLEPAADRIFADDRELAAGASDVLDLSGDLVDVYGRPAVFSALVTILIGASKLNSGDLTIGGDNDTPFNGPLSAGGRVTVAPGGFAQMACPDPERWAATATALRVSNPTGFPASYQLLLIGPPSTHIDGMLDFSDPENSGFIGAL